MSLNYSLNFTDTTLNPTPITVQAASSTSSPLTSLTFFGKNATGYGVGIQQDLLHLLENFYSATAPTNPVLGQTWFDANAQLLKVFGSNGWQQVTVTITVNNLPQIPWSKLTNLPTTAGGYGITWGVSDIPTLPWSKITNTPTTLAGYGITDAFNPLTGTVAKATAIAGGDSNELVYQTTAGTTSFVTAPTTPGQSLVWNGSQFAWGTSSVTVVEDNSTTQEMFVTFTDANSGPISQLKVSSQELTFNPGTNIFSVPQISGLSDERLKENVKELVNGIEVVKQLRAVSFSWKDTGINQTG